MSSFQEKDVELGGERGVKMWDKWSEEQENNKSLGKRQK